MDLIFREENLVRKFINYVMRSFIEAAKRVGKRVVGVLTTHRSIDLKAKTDFVIHDFTEGKALLKKLEN